MTEMSQCLLWLFSCATKSGSFWDT